MTPPAHGTWQRYCYTADRCRCDACRSAWASYVRELRRRHRGTSKARGERAQYLVRELATAGWSLRRLAAEVGVKHSTLARLATAERPAAHQRTLDALEAHRAAHADKRMGLRPAPLSERYKQADVTRATQRAIDRGWWGK